MTFDTRDPESGETVVHHVSNRQRRPRTPAKLLPMLTPMIDVTFMLLLFFMLSMQFRQAEGQIPADLPQLQGVLSRTQVPLEPIVVRLQRADATAEMPEITLGKAAAVASWDELFQRLDAMRQQGSDEIPILVRPDADVPWNDVVNAFNQAVRARFKTVTFAPVSQ